MIGIHSFTVEEKGRVYLRSLVRAAHYMQRTRRICIAGPRVISKLTTCVVVMQNLQTIRAMLGGYVFMALKRVSTVGAMPLQLPPSDPGGVLAHAGCCCILNEPTTVAPLTRLAP